MVGEEPQVHATARDGDDGLGEGSWAYPYRRRRNRRRLSYPRAELRADGDGESSGSGDEFSPWSCGKSSNRNHCVFVEPRRQGKAKHCCTSPPVNNPGKFEEFFPAGQYPQSFYQHLSRDVLEAALNTRSELLDRLLQANQSQQGMFRIASQEQIKTLSRGARSGGYVEMVVPSLSNQNSHGEEETKGGEYWKSSEIEEEKARREEQEEIEREEEKRGHPVTYIASHNQHVSFIAFGLSNRNNTRIFIAGKDNVVKQIDSEVKELAFGFGVPSSLIDEIFNNLPESYFVSRQSQNVDLKRVWATPKPRSWTLFICSSC
ncbi:hypothetical protein F3Y22_tig00112957pilonHSYRG00068 [Hibiscus syriacus]|uniref:Uncharacterized protein n=1 Tax=Hibiscus syriacus TaxID=106335 RepID=A0A6A2Y1L5_HIBSY|nr:hypothetical protein F3Y22_tig00112957pilonHSYRG00068 [Hibiscus syriacus]